MKTALAIIAALSTTAVTQFVMNLDLNRVPMVLASGI